MPSKSFEMPRPVTDKTAKTPLLPVLSVLSVSGLGYLRKKMTDLTETT